MRGEACRRMAPAWLISTLLGLVPLICGADQPAKIPHGQTEPPGDPLSPAEALKKMKVPDGFKVELVASEPDLVNPVAMTFDERGRIWVTESLEYPRHSAGVGRDRIKILEDTDDDGKADKFTVFAEGLNIPSGIAVGHGGVWVANAPDLLFLQDTDGDGKADKREVVVTGFGRFDTHELPNSLTWGPDGWLYGWNGVFNASRIAHRNKVYEFTCAIFRVHPKTRDFEIFCEGTSNPWGIAWDPEGSAFSSACVIDHLWHLVETGYYHRQGGPYPPYTWKIESIVDHEHQKAAYCGIHYFDSPAYPPAYRDRLYMGNIHGNGINVDTISRRGSTYRGDSQEDFLSANDAWFMPVSQKTGPDGCLYVLDWYDRYHCYQDANRDPAGIDRLKGRLYRIRHEATPRHVTLNMAEADDTQLILLLSSENVYERDIAQRLLAERNTPEIRRALDNLMIVPTIGRKARLHTLWARLGCGSLEDATLLALLGQQDATFRAWGARAAGNAGKVGDAVQDKIKALALDPSPDVRLQVAIASRKVGGIDALPVLMDVLSASADDPLIPRIVWRNLEPMLEDRGVEFTRRVSSADPGAMKGFSLILPLAIERLLGKRNPDPTPIVSLVEFLASGDGSRVALAKRALEGLASRVQTGEIIGKNLDAVRDGLAPLMSKVLAGSKDSPLFRDAAIVATSWRDPAGLAATREMFNASQTGAELRLRGLTALIAANDPEVIASAVRVLADRQGGTPGFRGQVLSALGKLDDPRVADAVLADYAKLEPDLQPRVIELLTQRASWSKLLLAAIGKGGVSKDSLNVNQVRRLMGSKDPELVALVKTQFGTVRESRDPGREQVIARIRRLLRAKEGDPHKGVEVFKKLCAQCHKIHGEGQDVGPEITLNGRNSFEQLLSNVFDPSLVIGAAYQATTVATTDGRVLTGLLAEDSPTRVVLKTQGGKVETIPRDQVDEMQVSALSLMPENLEEQLKPDEIVDLFAFLALDKSPKDPNTRPIPGTGELPPRAATHPRDYADILDLFAPGYSTSKVGEGGLAILKEHHGRGSVLRTHPVDEKTPCVLEAKVDVPAGKTTKLILDLSHHPRGDWTLVVKADGKVLHESSVGPDSAKGGWKQVAIDLTPFAGKTINLELENRASGWSWEFAYWGRISLRSE
ncbi:PVC-type heme-binding CxxCH protein [Singulisphaera sp. PoT]|uniref:PVC-type heme-binding CxxCH protein n=1 Tax=Singulisphaera sp. PoT TaxID=3411797 RepID=UPI003BF5AEB2